MIAELSVQISCVVRKKLTGQETVKRFLHTETLRTRAGSSFRMEDEAARTGPGRGSYTTCRRSPESKSSRKRSYTRELLYDSVVKNCARNCSPWRL